MDKDAMNQSLQYRSARGSIPTTVSSRSGLISHGGVSLFEGASNHLPMQQERSLKERRTMLVDHRLLSYREDLSEWFSKLFDKNISEATFITEIDNGVLLCRLALLIDSKVPEEQKVKGYAVGHGKMRTHSVRTKIRFNSSAKKKSFFARDNVETFIKWARMLGIDNSVIFETSDLVDLKNERTVLYTLMEIARVQDVIEPPSLIKLERALEGNKGALKEDVVDDEELEIAIDRLCVKLNTPRSRIKQRKSGEFTVDGSKRTLALLRGSVVVHNGKHWDSLEQFLLQDPQENNQQSWRNASKSTSSNNDDDSDGAFGSKRSSKTSMYSSNNPSNVTSGNASKKGSSNALPIPRGRRNSNNDSLSFSGSSNINSPPKRNSDEALSSSYGVIGSNNKSNGYTAPSSQSPNRRRHTSTEYSIQRNGSSLSPTRKGSVPFIGSKFESSYNDQEKTLLEDTIASMKRENARLKRDVEALKLEREDAEKQIKQSKQNLREAQQHLKDLPDIAALQKQNKELISGNDLLNDRLRSTVESMETMQKDYKRELNEKELDVEDRNEIIKELEEELNAAKSSIGGGLGEINAMEDQLRQASSALNQKTLELQRLQSIATQHEECEQRYMNAHNESQDALKRVAELERLLKEMDSVESGENAVLKEQMERAKGDLSLQGKRIETLHDSIKAKEDEIQHLLTQLQARADEKEKAVQRVRELENEKLHQEHDSADAINDLKVRLQTQGNSLEALEEDNKRLRSLADAAATDTQRKNLELKDTQKAQRALQIRLDSNTQSENALQQRISELEGIQRKLERERDQYKTQLEQMKEKMNAVATRVDDLEQEQRQQSEEEGKEKADLITKLNDCTDSKEILNGTIATLQNALDKASTDINDLQSQLDAANAQNEELEDECASNKTKLDEVEADLHNLRRTCARAEGENSTLKNSTEEQQQKLRSILEEGREKDSKIAELESFLKNAQKNLNVEGTRAQKLDDELLAVKEKNKALQDELAREKEESENLSRDRDRAIDDMLVLEQVHEDLLVQLQNMDERTQALENKIEVQSGSVDDLKTLAEKLVSKLTRCEEERDAAYEDADNLREKMDAERFSFQKKQADEEEKRRVEEERKRREEEKEQKRKEEEEERLQLLKQQQEEEQRQLEEEEEERRRMEEEEEEARRRREEEEEAQRLLEEEERAAEEAHRRMMEERQKDESFRNIHSECEPIRDDLAEWFNELFGTQYTADTLLRELQTGLPLVYLANMIDLHEEEMREDDKRAQEMKKRKTSKGRLNVSSTSFGSSSPRKSEQFQSSRKSLPEPVCQLKICAPAAFEGPRLKRRKLPKYKYTPPDDRTVDTDFIKSRSLEYCPIVPKTKPQTKAAERNIRAFIAYSRGLGLNDPDVFNVKDLTELEDQRRVLWGILDVARRTRRMRLPRLVWIEKLRYMQRPKPKDDLEKQVRTLVDKSINQPRIKVTRVDNTKYLFGEDMTKPVTLIVRAKNVLVRVGGGFITLEEYIDKHMMTDHKMFALRDKYKEEWEADESNPEMFPCFDDHKMCLHTSRGDHPYY
eukprot:m.143240 g.143240  ORF g.143240 m.143240 type:complete len:1552 (+) comp13204_c0_seq1:95-4750(+)